MSSVIGIHDGHNASAALVRDGTVEIALQEERLTRTKNQGDIPAGAVREALHLVPGWGETGGTGPAKVAVSGRYVNYGQWRRETILRDYDRSSRFPERWRQPLKNTVVDRVYQRRKAEIRAHRLEELGFGLQHIEAVEHHAAHAAAAYHTAPFLCRSPREKVLVLTCDGAGDRLSATVSIGQNGSLDRIAEVPEQDSIGRLYALVTRHLGMAPLEHEYKVMGLAPYGQRGSQAGQTWPGYFRNCSNLRRILWCGGAAGRVPSMYAASGFLDRLLAGCRFDAIAWPACRDSLEQYAHHLESATPRARRGHPQNRVCRAECS